MRRPWIVPALMVLAVAGFLLIITADEDAGPALDDITTVEGLITRVPSGWVVSADLAFEFAPPSENQGFDLWSVARACPLDGCGERSLAEWISLADFLPTFDSVSEAEGESVFNIESEGFDDARVLRAQTEAGGRLVFVAAFTDGASSYVACSARLAIGTDQDLADALVDVCRDTEPLD